MAQSVYVTSAEGHTGKSTVAIGVLHVLKRQAPRVGVFRPVAYDSAETDHVLEMLHQRSSTAVPLADCVGVDYSAVHADPEEALTTIVARYRTLQAQCDAVLILGSDYTDVSAPTELSFNARVAATLRAPVVLVLGGRHNQGQPEMLGQSQPRSAEEIRVLAELSLAELRHAHATLLAVVINRAADALLQPIITTVSSLPTLPSGVPVWSIPELSNLVAPTMGSVCEAVSGTLIRGNASSLEREASCIVVAGMSMEHVLPRLAPGAVVVVPSDRSEVLLAVLLANASPEFPNLAGVVLNGGFALSPEILRLVDGFEQVLPIIQTELGTYDTALRVTHTRGKLAADSEEKYGRALSLCEQHMPADQLSELLQLPEPAVLTPTMFAYGLFERARSAQAHIVLPEGSDDRILQAAHRLLRRSVARLSILGEPESIRQRAATLGLDISAAELIDPASSALLDQFAAEYARLREHKGMTVSLARDIVTDVSYFGTMMVHLGLADGMVSGAAHTTAHTIRPSFEIIKTLPGVSIVSSVFLMALADRVMVYGDCAVNPHPNAQQLADIALSSAHTAAQFGIEPRVAMLSYSTGSSGSGAEVELVRTATELAQQRNPELLIAGPIQYDAATDASVAAAKLPGSPVAGRATVCIFPDLNTGNNTYKAVQRTSGAVAIGPVLQGLRKPVNDLSRGATVEDIVNTVVITAIQASEQEAAQ